MGEQMAARKGMEHVIKRRRSRIRPLLRNRFHYHVYYSQNE